MSGVVEKNETPEPTGARAGSDRPKRSPHRCVIWIDQHDGWDDLSDGSRPLVSREAVPVVR